MRGIIAVGLVVVSLISYCNMKQTNPVTGESQHVAMSTSQEVALGLEAAPQMAAQHGGEVKTGPDAELVHAMGQHLVRTYFRDKENPYRFEFHLLADEKVINAFALPGGQVFITRALYNRLETEGQLAGVLGHEIGHVIERHGAEHMAKAQLTQGLTSAAAMAAYDPEKPGTAAAAAVAQMVGNLVNMKYGRNDELESDEWGIDLCVQAGYDPRAMIGVMEILDEATKSGRPPEFMSSHPDPGNRIGRLEELIAAKFPNGVPRDLEP
ncbi:MAG: M48 family metalloprotease [Armatimonadetes bacterium]|nr:M48 family metalloprotease [Armatimonadota bacterium]